MIKKKQKNCLKNQACEMKVLQKTEKVTIMDRMESEIITNSVNVKSVLESIEE